MAKWIEKPGLSAGQLADGDKMLVGDVSEAVGSRDKTVTLGDLRTFLGAGISVPVAQAAHGLAVGDVIRHDGAAFVQATADTTENALAVGIVTSVPDTNNFTYQATGIVTGLSGLAAGELYYLQDDGSLGTTAGTVEKPILIAVSTTAAVLILAIGGGGAESLGDLDDVDTSGASDGDVLVYDGDLGMWVPGAGGNAYYDLQMGFAGNPSAGATHVVLASRAVTIDAGDPGEVYVGVNPTDGTATLDVQVNGVSAGGIEISTGGVVTWNLAAPIVLAAGDRLALVAPTPADSTLADVLVAFRGTAT